MPSGKTVEVVYFEDLAVPEGAITTQPVHPDLHVCERCASELVHPVEWVEAGPDHWEVDLLCPNCEWETTGVFAQDAVERFDEILDEGMEKLLGDLRRLMHANFEEEIDRFVDALRAGLVMPEDF